jgi:hypothetical protein
MGQRQQAAVKEYQMSRKNIFMIQPVPKGVLVSFTTDEGLRHYRYGATAAKKIKEGRDPADFSAKEIVVPKKVSS